MARRKKNDTISSWVPEFDRYNEVMARSYIMKYFQGKPKFWHTEGCGVLAGSALCFFFAFIAMPSILQTMEGFFSPTELGFKIAQYFLIAAGSVLLVKSFFQIRKDRKRVYEPCTEDRYERIIAFDMVGAQNKGAYLLKLRVPDIKEGRVSIDGIEPMILTVPEDYTSNVNLPVLFKVSDGGILRCSNYEIYSFYFCEDRLYIYSTYYNSRDGSSRFDHVFECAYDNIEEVVFERFERTLANQRNKAQKRRAKSLLIKAKEGDTKELYIDVVNFDFLDKYGGRTHVDDVIKVVEKFKNLGISASVNDSETFRYVEPVYVEPDEDEQPVHPKAIMPRQNEFEPEELDELEKLDR